MSCVEIKDLTINMCGCVIMQIFALVSTTFLTRGLRQTRLFWEFPPSRLNDHSCSFSYLKLSTHLRLPYGVLCRLVLSDNSANMLRQVPFVFLCNSWSIALLMPLYWFSVYKIVSYNIRFCIHLLSIGYSVNRNCTLNAEAHR